MTLRLITPPAVEPVSVETAKQHLRVDHSADDALITSYLKTARELGEGLARRAFITQTVEWVMDRWPTNGAMKLPRPPLQSVTSVKYLDTDQAEQTWTDYVVDARSEPGWLIFRSTPSGGLFDSGAIAVRFVAGYGNTAETVPNVFIQGILLTVAHWYENREAVMLSQGFEIPLGVRPLFTADRGSLFE
jgi:uncharacterized phiE125 gp8 family phage protein